MDNKLQELTQKLYEEGLQKGRSEAESVVATAKADAAKILESATAEAQSIIAKAEERAAESAKNSLTEISLAGRQALAKIKAEITNSIVTASISEGVKSAAMDGKFISDMMLAVANNWSADSACVVSLEALLPEAQKSTLDATITSNSAALLKAGIEVGYSESVKSGFKIGEKDGGYYISFSEEEFDALMRTYLRSKVSDLLFKA